MYIKCKTRGSLLNMSNIHLFTNSNINLFILLLWQYISYYISREIRMIKRKYIFTFCVKLNKNFCFKESHIELSFIQLSIYLSVCLSTYLSIYLFIQLYLYSHFSAMLNIYFSQNFFYLKLKIKTCQKEERYIHFFIF